MDHAIESKAIVDQLNKILGSDQFAAAFRIKKLLKFLMNETLAGRAHQIKAFTIGKAVFDRASDSTITGGSEGARQGRLRGIAWGRIRRGKVRIGLLRTGDCSFALLRSGR